MRRRPMRCGMTDVVVVALLAALSLAPSACGGGDDASASGDVAGSAGGDVGGDVGGDLLGDTAQPADGDGDAPTPPPVITTEALPDARRGAAYHEQLAVEGGAAPLRWRVLGALPAGLALTPASGEVRGTPLEEGLFDFEVEVLDANRRRATRALAIEVAAGSPLHVTTDWLPSSVVGYRYEQGLAAENPSGDTVRWRLVDGTLPVGLTLDEVAGVLSGTAESVGAWGFAIGAETPGTRQRDERGFFVAVYDSPFFFSVVDEAALPPATPGEPYEACLAMINPAPWFSLEVTSGALPPGLTLDGHTGCIAGTADAGGVYSFELTASEATHPDNRSAKTFGIAVSSDLVIETTELPVGVRGEPYAASLRTRGGTGSFRWEILSGELPSNLRLDTQAGSIDGTPREIGEFPLVVEVRDRNDEDRVASVSLTLTIVPLRIGTAELPPGYLGQPYDLSLAVEGVAESVTWFLAAGDLGGTGLAFEASGRLHGTVAIAAERALTIRVADDADAGVFAERDYVLTLTDRVDVTTTALPGGAVGLAYHAQVEAAGGSGSYRFSVTEGRLPPGVALGAAGALSGVAAEVGVFAFTVRATDATDEDKWGERPFSISIGEPAGGDVNGDGIPDLVIGAPWYFSPTYFTMGRVYVFFGGTSVAGDRDGSTADVVLDGDLANGCAFALDVAVGDLNGDGTDDIAAGDMGSCHGWPGRVYVFYGGPALASRTAPEADVTIVGPTVEEFGSTVAAAGDVTGDAVADLVVGAPACQRAGPQPGKVYVFAGGALPAQGSAADATAVLTGESDHDCFGGALVSGVDATGDGTGDLLIGASAAESSRQGRAYLFAGGAGLADGSADAATAVIVGEEASEFGGAVAMADVVGDGAVDLIVGAAWYDTWAGRVYVFPGGGTWPESAADAAVVLTGDATDDSTSGGFGWTLTTGDLDGDGRDDLAIGDPYHCNPVTCPGRVAVVWGADTLPSATAGASDRRLDGLAADEAFGERIWAGDFNGDGQADLAVAAPDSSSIGLVYVFSAATAPPFLTLRGEGSDTGFGRFVP